MKRISRTRQAGFTLIELMIAVALIGLLMGIAIPTYTSYQTSVRMSKTSAHFDEAVRLAKTVFAKELFELSVGKAPSRPTTDTGWVTLFTSNGGTAPLGGPAFIANTTGDTTTGAIGVYVVDDGHALMLIRPKFFNMVPVQARIDNSEVQFTET